MLFQPLVTVQDIIIMKVLQKIVWDFCCIFIILMNSINWRFGRNYLCDVYSYKRIKDLIDPGMVVLTHKKHELSNFLIPGYWTHAAIIATDEYIVEATSKGVQKSNIEEFLTFVDDFVILKPAFCTSQLMIRAGKCAINTVGNPYNFTFNHDNNAYYCSELIYRAYACSCRWLNSYLEKGIIIPNSIYESKDLWEVVH